nr:DNA-directed DNA polymerase [Tanacetum cinerariifolium]
MLAIFHNMIEESVKVFMDDFTVFRDSFNKFLNNLDKMLQRCKDANLVLNWEKCHFMVKEGIMLGHKVSGAGLEVDKVKNQHDLKTSTPTNIKDTPFEFDDECQKAFELLKEKLTWASVIISLNWNLSFELMCDASDFTVRAVIDDEPMWAADCVVALTPGSAITIPETTNEFAIKADLRASINLMPYSLYAKLSLETLKPTKMSVRLVDMSFQYHVGIAENMLVEVGKFTFPANFVILEMEEDIKVPLILGRPFLHTVDAVIRVKQKQLNLGVGTKRIIFNIDFAMKHSYSNDDTCFRIDVIDEIIEEDFDALLDDGSKILHSIERTLLEEEIFVEFDEFIAMTADEDSESESDTEEPPFKKITINIDYKIKTYLEEPPTDLKHKPLPDNLEYVFLEEPSFLPKTTDIPGICPSFYKHKIQLLDDKKPVVQKQRLLNPNMQEVVKKEIIKLLDTGIIYPIADSPWVSLIYCVPKKGGIIVVTNKNDELVPTRTVIGWRLSIDYHKLNEATAKDHFPLSFMDQMLERLAGNKYFCFLNGFFGYFQIPIDHMDQEKTTFTCPFGTYAYRRMAIGLCNTPTTFQRCMLAISHDMIEESIEVLMDDFFVFGDSFDKCLNNLDKNAPALQRCSSCP